MSSPVDIEVTGDDEVPAWMADNDVELQKIPSSAANNNHNGNIIRAPTPSSSAVNNANTNTNTNNSSNNNTRNGEVLPDWSIEDGHPVAIGVPVSPVIVDRNISTSAPTTAAMTTTTITTTNLSINNNNNTPSTENADIASKKTWKKYCQEIFERDGRLLIITLIILICMNIPIVKWVLYPFTIFSTWIHEVCHGFAALIVGGSISKIMIYPDTSGLAYTSANPARRGFIASAGYQGTAVIGCLLLLFRRTKRGPRTGTMIVAVMMVLSCCLWIRNLFGFVFIFCSGLLLIGVSLKLPSNYMRDVYVVLAVTCSLNAITSVHDLFGNTNVVNGDASQSSDAHTMSEVVGGSYILWALLWLLLALLLTLIGFVFAVPGPDEVADFSCCGVCQDYGCFRVCNYPGQRYTERIFGSRRSDDNTDEENNSNSNRNTT